MALLVGTSNVFTFFSFWLLATAHYPQSMKRVELCPIVLTKEKRKLNKRKKKKKKEELSCEPIALCTYENILFLAEESSISDCFSYVI